MTLKTLRDVCSDLTRWSQHDFKGRFDPWWKKFCIWPPNAFALSSLVLADSAAYRRAIAPPCSDTWMVGTEQWQRQVTGNAEAWLKWRHTRGRMPAFMQGLTAIFKAELDTKISDIEKNFDLCAAFLALHAAADEACAGCGIPQFSTDVVNPSFFFVLEANLRLAGTGSLGELSTEVIRVLPKLRTPQVGITLRSLSHNLSVHQGEVDVFWLHSRTLCKDEDQKLNLLFLPWPEEIPPTAFKPSSSAMCRLDSGKFAGFKFDPEGDFPFNELEQLVQEAKKRVGQVHGLVLPECAVAKKDLGQLESVLEREGLSLLVAGVRADRQNYAHLAVIDADGSLASRSQFKHHRWCLDAGQIQAYHLGSALHPKLHWWEDIEIAKRELNFVTANGWLTICHLICEDLARQEPVAPLLRAVGPTLVIALLLDGPQLAGRWSARYASVLADDPGSSVLSVTCLGMSLRSRPSGMQPSRVVGLWRDRQTGVRELALDQGAQGLVLCLCANMVEEWTADGRTDGTKTSELVLSGVEQIRLKK
jgi:hypothetical protein